MAQSEEKKQEITSAEQESILVEKINGIVTSPSSTIKRGDGSRALHLSRAKKLLREKIASIQDPAQGQQIRVLCVRARTLKTNKDGTFAEGDQTLELAVLGTHNGKIFTKNYYCNPTTAEFVLSHVRGGQRTKLRGHTVGSYFTQLGGGVHIYNPQQQTLISAHNEELPVVIEEKASKLLKQPPPQQKKEHKISKQAHGMRHLKHLGKRLVNLKEKAEKACTEAEEKKGISNYIGQICTFWRSTQRIPGAVGDEHFVTAAYDVLHPTIAAKCTKAEQQAAAATQVAGDLRQQVQTLEEKMSSLQKTLEQTKQTGSQATVGNFSRFFRSTSFTEGQTKDKSTATLSGSGGMLEAATSTFSAPSMVSPAASTTSTSSTSSSNPSPRR